MTHRKIDYSAFIFLFLAIFLSGCVQKPKEEKLTSINIAFQSWVGYGPFYLAQEKGFCREEGIDLNIIDEQLDSSRRDAFKQGMLDFEGGTIDLLVSKVAQDTPILAVMELDRSFGSDAIVADKDIDKLEDLVGKRVALARDDVGETFFSFLLFKQGLPIDKVRMVSVDSEGVAKAFLSDEADACATWEPQVSEALKKPGAHILVSSREYQGIIIDTLNVRRDLFINHPQLVRGLMRAWFKALRYYKENPARASEIIAKYYKITPAEYRKQVEGLKWSDYEKQNINLRYKEWVDAFDVIAQIKFTNKRILQKPDSLKYLDRSLLEGLYEDRT